MIHGVRSNYEKALEFAHLEADKIQKQVVIVKTTYGAKGSKSEFLIKEPEDLIFGEKHELILPVPPPKDKKKKDPYE